MDGPPLHVPEDAVRGLPGHVRSVVVVWWEDMVSLEAAAVVLGTVHAVRAVRAAEAWHTAVAEANPFVEHALACALTGPPELARPGRAAHARILLWTGAAPALAGARAQLVAARSALATLRTSASKLPVVESSTPLAGLAARWIRKIGARLTHAARVLAEASELTKPQVLPGDADELQSEIGFRLISGVPATARAASWTGALHAYLAHHTLGPPRTHRTAEYSELVARHWGPDASVALDETALHQISVDVPRTQPKVLFFKESAVTEAMERIGVVFTASHGEAWTSPVAYAQGMLDLSAPFLLVFYAAAKVLPTRGVDDSVAEHGIDADALDSAERLAFVCLRALIEALAHCFTPNREGVSHIVRIVHGYVADLAPELDAHLRQHLEYAVVVFRWINCVFVREFDLESLIRLWDGLLLGGSAALPGAIAALAAALLLRARELLLGLDSTELLMAVQDLASALGPWDAGDVQALLVEANALRSLRASKSEAGTP
ncbi:TBC1 domain family member 22A [Thecamonas trahens ATCC 50062]|uniref:TBC1 domain family member 22A n=1 Tax=Thecamonas trahens ATCC 50062 TaxID=461836 RepID=A0A0L0DWA5_THETB|nr:TBC1 domain family member 22A [Thecamonas trahens ATCC 50062]KNC56366.1 TBC1 domain family member 22A [Thecamonas trahens ATCC 50062]|eukprot:XP_013760881.1 TBC1 domain family member 22A [Thecamonas trahens ATCC 50062]